MLQMYAYFIQGEDLSTGDLSLKTNISVSSIYSIESGRRTPDIDKFIRLCEALNYEPYIAILESFNLKTYPKLTKAIKILKVIENLL